MPNYERMYALLCCAASEAIDRLPQTPENLPVVSLLQQALNGAEELYIQDAHSDLSGDQNLYNCPIDIWDLSL